jgi:predicted metal-dependent phosphoesterase TrpH
MYSDWIPLDMHVHSIISRDSLLSLGQINRLAMKTGITPIICDHNSILGSFEYQKRGFFHNELIPSILSEEVKTTGGEIIGLFLTEEIVPYLSPEETLDIIRDQGGVSIIPHAGDRFRKSAMNFHMIQPFIRKIDGIEAFNSRTLLLEDIRSANNFAKQHHLPITGGSDAHCRWELFQTITFVKPFDGPKEFIQSIKSAKISFRRTIPLFHLVSIMTRRLRR